MKRAALLLLLSALTFSLVAQEEEENSRKGKFFLIPEIWLSFGSSTYIDIAPMVGYHVLDRLALGLGPHYIYQSYHASSSIAFDYHTHSYGLKGFIRFSLITIARVNDNTFEIEWAGISSMLSQTRRSRRSWC